MKFLIGGPCSNPAASNQAMLEKNLKYRSPLRLRRVNRQLYWNSHQDAAMASTFDLSEEGNSLTPIAFGTPEVLFSGNGRFSTTTWPYWDYLSETDEFVIIRPEISVQDILGSQTQLFVVENWFDELTSQAPRQ